VARSEVEASGGHAIVTGVAQKDEHFFADIDAKEDVVGVRGVACQKRGKQLRAPYAVERGGAEEGANVENVDEAEALHALRLRRRTESTAVTKQRKCELSAETRVVDRWGRGGHFVFQKFNGRSPPMASPTVDSQPPAESGSEPASMPVDAMLASGVPAQSAHGAHASRFVAESGVLGAPLLPPPPPPPQAPPDVPRAPDQHQSLEDPITGSRAEPAVQPARRAAPSAAAVNSNRLSGDNDSHDDGDDDGGSPARAAAADPVKLVRGCVVLVLIFFFSFDCCFLF